MRSYTVATAALTLGVTAKWLDNTLSHHQLDGVVHARQGISRRLSQRAILDLRLTLTLISALGTPLHKALTLARLLADTEGNSGLVLPQGLHLSVDIADVRSQVVADLAKAVEVAPVPKRGRRPLRK